MSEKKVNLSEIRIINPNMANDFSSCINDLVVKSEYDNPVIVVTFVDGSRISFIIKENKEVGFSVDL